MGKWRHSSVHSEPLHWTEVSGQLHAPFALLQMKVTPVLIKWEATWPQWETAVAQWLRCCATNRKIPGSIPAGVSGFFIDIKSFRSHSASNRIDYQEYFLRVRAAGT